MATPTFTELIKARNFTVRLRLETGGRKGKTVTLLDGFPKSEVALKDILKTLKTMCGAGGTFHLDGKDGVIEIQGDHRDRIREYLQNNGIKVKG